LRDASDAQDALAAAYAARAGAHGFEDGRAVYGLQEGIDLGLVAREFYGVAFSVTSMMRPRKMSAMRFISSRSLPTARTLTIMSSRSV